MSEALNSFKETATKALDHFIQELRSLRTGGATSQLLDDVKVEAYGTYMQIQEVASVQVVDATLLQVTPWDKSLLQAIEKAISSANLNLNPVVDGAIIRIAVPPLTEEKRRETVKQLHALEEEAKVLLRSARASVKRAIEDDESEAGVSEDDTKRLLLDLEKQMQEYTDKIESMSQKKETQLLQL